MPIILSIAHAHARGKLTEEGRRITKSYRPLLLRPGLGGKIWAILLNGRDSMETMQGLWVEAILALTSLTGVLNALTYLGGA